MFYGVRPWVGYVRVSHVGGRAGDSFRSPDDQRLSIEAWARARGEPLVMLDPELDESGGRADRPILSKAVAGIEAGRYRGLVVAYLSRASRSTRHLLELWERVEDAGGQVMSVAENLDTSTPSGRLTRTMMVAIAEHELDGHRERFEGLRVSATKAGIWQRRQLPLGYSKGEDRRLVPNRDALRVVAAFEARRAGAPMVQLARDLNMTASGVRALLHNRVYLGELKVGAHVNTNAHPAIVSVDLFDEVQATRVTRSPRPGKEPALLAGLVRCVGCGHVMSRAQSKVPVYACAVNHSNGKCPLPATITVRLIDEHVEKIALTAIAAFQGLPSEDDGRLEQARADVSAAQRELEAFLDGVNAAGISPASYASALRVRQDAIDHAREAVSAIVTRRPAMAAAANVDVLWVHMSGRQRNHLLRSLIETVLVKRAGGRGVMVPVGDRVRVLAIDAGAVPVTGANSDGHPVAGLGFPAYDDPRVLGVHLPQN